MVGTHEKYSLCIHVKILVMMTVMIVITTKTIIIATTSTATTPSIIVTLVTMITMTITNSMKQCLTVICQSSGLKKLRNNFKNT